MELNTGNIFMHEVKKTDEDGMNGITKIRFATGDGKDTTLPEITVYGVSEGFGGVQAAKVETSSTGSIAGVSGMSANNTRVFMAALELAAEKAEEYYEEYLER